MIEKILEGECPRCHEDVNFVFKKQELIPVEPPQIMYTYECNRCLEDMSDDEIYMHNHPIASEIELGIYDGK